MQNKRIVLLGDASIAEVFHDFAMLLSGVSNEPREDIITSYIATATNREKGGGRETWRYDLPNDVFVEFHGLHRRNMTLYAPNNVVVRYRFTGHYDLGKNLMGIDTFFDKNFKEEFSCLLGVNKDTYDCPRPDIILINRFESAFPFYLQSIFQISFITLWIFFRVLFSRYSGFHDSPKEPPSHFEKRIKELFSYFKTKYGSLTLDHAPHIIWKGNLIGCERGVKASHLFELNTIAEDVTNEFGITFINTTNVLQYVPRWHESTRHHVIYTKDCMHYGAMSIAQNFEAHGTISMLVTQTLLQELCVNDMKKDILHPQGIARQATHVHRTFLEGEFRKTNDVWEGRNRIHQECLPGEECFLRQISKHDMNNPGMSKDRSDAKPVGAYLGYAAKDHHERHSHHHVHKRKHKRLDFLAEKLVPHGKTFDPHEAE